MMKDFDWVAKRTVRKAVTNLVPLRLHWKLACARGVLFSAARGVPDQVRNNLNSVFGDVMEGSEIERIAHQNVELRNRLDPLKDVLPRFCSARARSHWKIEGSEFLDESLTAGRGAILLTAHLGYSKLIMPILRSHGYDAKGVVAKTMASIDREARLERSLKSSRIGGVLIRRMLLKSGYEQSCIAAQLDIRPILSALAQNKPVLLAGDGLKAAEFVQLPLLGGSYPFAKGFMKIAMRTGAAVLPTFAIEGNNGYWVVVKIQSPLEIDPDATVEHNLMKFARILDRQIRAAPHLWYRWGNREDLGKIDRLPAGAWTDRWNHGVRRARK